MRVILSSTLPFTPLRAHTRSRSCQRAQLKPSWEDAEVTGKEAARIGTPGDGRRGDRVTIQSPSSPECAPCVEGHRLVVEAWRAPGIPATLSRAEGPGPRDPREGSLAHASCPADSPLHCPPSRSTPVGPGMDPRPSTACLMRAAEQTAVFILCCSRPVYWSLESSVPLCSFEGYSHWIPFSTYISVSEHLSCSLRELSRVLCLRYAPVHYAALVPLSPVSLDSSLQIITQLSCYPTFQLWRYLPLCVSSCFSAAVSRSVYLRVLSSVYAPFHPSLC